MMYKKGGIGKGRNKSRKELEAYARKKSGHHSLLEYSTTSPICQLELSFQLKLVFESKDLKYDLS